MGAVRAAARALRVQPDGAAPAAADGATGSGPARCQPGGGPPPGARVALLHRRPGGQPGLRLGADERRRERHRADLGVRDRHPRPVRRPGPPHRGDPPLGPRPRAPASAGRRSAHVRLRRPRLPDHLHHRPRGTGRGTDSVYRRAGGEGYPDHRPAGDVRGRVLARSGPDRYGSPMAWNPPAVGTRAAWTRAVTEYDVERFAEIT